MMTSHWGNQILSSYHVHAKTLRCTAKIAIAVCAFFLLGASDGPCGGRRHTTYSISGSVSGATAAGVTITLSGASSATTTTDDIGAYSFVWLGNGNYTITPTAAGYTFSPVSSAVTVSGADVSVPSFVASVPHGKSAILIDTRLYSLVKAEIDAYWTKAQARRGFAIDLLPVNGIDDFTYVAVREYIKELKSSNVALEGVLFVGNIKIPSFFQSRADNLDVRLLPRFFEDLDGVFRKDLSEGSTIPLCTGAWEHCYTGGTASVRPDPRLNG